MGIKNLSKLLNEYCGEASCLISLDELNGKKVAVDMPIYVYRYIKSYGGGTMWLESILHFIITLRKHGIIPICIFDGPMIPPEKKVEQTHRIEEFSKLQKKMEKMVSLIDEQQNKPNDSIQELHEKINRLNVRLELPDTISGVVSTLETRVENLKKQTIIVTDEHYDKVISLMRYTGTPYIKAHGEAESLCAELYFNGYVDAVLSNDSDLLAYGIDLVLSNIDISSGVVKATIHKLVLEYLGLSRKQFLDLCIMMRCDYNKRTGSIFGYPPDGKKRRKPVALGYKSSYIMIKEYGSISKMKDHIVDLAPLKYKRCRELFKVKTCSLMIVPEIEDVNQLELSRFIKDNQLRINTETVISRLNNKRILKDDFSPSLEGEKSPSTPKEFKAIIYGGDYKNNKLYSSSRIFEGKNMVHEIHSFRLNSEIFQILESPQKISLSDLGSPPNKNIDLKTRANICGLIDVLLYVLNNLASFQSLKNIDIITNWKDHKNISALNESDNKNIKNSDLVNSLLYLIRKMKQNEIELKFISAKVDSKEYLKLKKKYLTL